MSSLRPVFAVLALACALLGGAPFSRAQAPQQAPAPAQESQARFAFIVGNDAYEGAPLATAANDAALVADALKAAKFDVMGARNLDQDTLRASYREFLAKVAGAGANAVSVVYISGYGLQFDGENYVVPPGATIARDADISLNAIRLSDLVRALSGSPGRGRVVLLDLAYDSPFAKQVQGIAPGLAIVEPEAGTIVGFNAAPGVWAAPGKEPYGPYAQALSEMLREAGLPLEEILTRVRTRTAELTKGAQVPWSAGRIQPPVVLLERAPDAPAPAVAPEQIAAERAKPVDKLPEALAYSAVIDRDTVKGYEDFVAAYPQSPYTKNVQGLLAARREARTWRRTLDINTQSAYWSYLKRYPRGPHAADARRRLARLQAALEPPPSFDPVVYDDPPPPPVELAYFDGPEVSYYDPGVPPLGPSIFVAAPPPWYQPPPPPVFDDEDDFFLPEVVTVVSAPAWIAPPPYVLPPPVPYMMETRPPGWRPFVAIPAALAVGLAAGRLSNRYFENRRQNLGPQNRPPRPTVMPAISALPKGMNLPAGVRPGQPIVRPVNAPGGQQPLVRPGQPGAGAGGLQPGQGVVRPNNALPNLPAGQQGQRPGQIGQPGGPAGGNPFAQPGTRPGQPQVGQPQQPGQLGRPAGGQPIGTPPGGQGAVGQPIDKRQQLIQQRQQAQEQRKLQLEQQKLQRQQQFQQQQQQRAQQQQQRQQQMQEQRARQQQSQQQRMQQLQQQRQSQQQRQLLMQQQRQQQMDQRRVQQQQMQRTQQMQQQRAIQQQQLQQQRMMQQRQQQQIMQQQRQQQMLMQQRQQQMMQQRQQQMQQRQQQYQPRRCPPGLYRC